MIRETRRTLLFTVLFFVVGILAIVVKFYLTALVAFIIFALLFLNVVSDLLEWYG